MKKGRNTTHNDLHEFTHTILDLPTVSLNGILTDVLKEVKTQVVSFCVTRIFKKPSSLKTWDKVFLRYSPILVGEHFGTGKTKKNITFHCCRSKQKSNMSWKLHTDHFFLQFSNMTFVFTCDVFCFVFLVFPLPKVFSNQILSVSQKYLVLCF